MTAATGTPLSSASPARVTPWYIPPALSKQQRLTLLTLILCLFAFGGLVEIRGALLRNRHTDAGTYFRAAWAVREGANPYLTVDRNGWHYTYPPTLAALITPLADAPAGYSRFGLLPYGVSVGIWCVLNLSLMLVGIGSLANALQEALGSSGNEAADARRWWELRFWPLLLCLPVICRSAIRGQVGPIWLWLCCETVAAVIRRQPLRAGFWLAASICLKLIPLYLLIYPLWRRSGRMLAGCLVGLAVGGVLIPWLAMGSRAFVEDYQQYLDGMVLPGLTGARMSRAVEHELLDPRTSDTQAFRSVLMNIGHMVADTPRSYHPPLFARAGHWILAGLLTGGLLLASGWRARRDPLEDALLLASLMVLMLPISPVCHPHYLLLMLPMLAVLLARWMRPDEPTHQGAGWTVLLVLIPVSHIITSLPHADPFRDSGLVIWVASANVIGAAWLLWRRREDLPTRAARHPMDVPPTAWPIPN